ncbi:Aste57867_10057 [Aphanomyces stellatus]|uniref:Aste57867_10057 protein n=1 Tax=Aphanomyces stellatus TaxID=120398 RepID=A0A485KPD9_9STRA|nr:hypothetical protein As57867_010018 [Aphanomyces stellatus]VFT86933.1 Aste57867_10057 [Aphanomyces stellatus]
MASTTPSDLDLVRRKCLDAAWVSANAASLHLDPNARDPTSHAKLNPWLRSSLPTARFQVNDARTYNPTAFTSSCGYREVVAGVGATVDATGNVVNKGRIAGTFVAEYGGWASIDLTTYVNVILLQEVLGYDVSFVYIDSSSQSTARMSTSARGQCTPTHFNPEVWSAAHASQLDQFASAASVSIIGYYGRSGHYTLKANVDQALQGRNLSRGFSSDFWREYTLADDLISFYSMAKHDRTRVAYPQHCPDGTGGCLNGCSKSYACTLYEAQGKTCMLVLMMEYGYDVGYIQAMIANNNVPAYFCFAGYTNVGNYILDVMARNGSITFYHYEPDMFHFDHPGKFARVAWPLADPAKVALATGSFGELGYVVLTFVMECRWYGNASTNPLNVDFPQLNLLKYYSSILRNDPFLSHYLDKLQLTQLDMNTMLQTLSGYNKNSTVQNPTFNAACDWVKANYATWQAWPDPLPLCSIQTHVNYTISGCTATSRQVAFAWSQPDPTNASQPFVCDGGVTTLPAPLRTSRACDWLTTNPNVWLPWTLSPPVCDSSFFAYTISPCTTTATRLVTFGWLLPTEANSSVSTECINGIPLPSNAVIQCDFVPYNSTVATAITAFSIVIVIGLLVLMVLIVHYRNRPIIKRSQWPLLLTMLSGGIFLCVYVLMGAGPPSYSTCGGRPVVVSLGYTLVFGSLFVKSLRVYLVFNNKAMKRVKISLWDITKVLLAILGIDMGDIISSLPLKNLLVTLVGIVVVWLLVDFPAPTSFSSPTTEFVGTVDHVSCHSSNFIFTTLSIFWKCVVTFGGVFIAYRIRHADSDFQESIWIFASCCIVFVGGLLMMALSYVATLSPPAAYTFESIWVLLLTAIVMGLMIGPKLMRLSAVAPAETTSKKPRTSDSVNPSRFSSGKTVPVKSRVQVVSENASKGDRVSSESQSTTHMTTASTTLIVGGQRREGAVGSTSFRLAASIVPQAQVMHHPNGVMS